MKTAAPTMVPSVSIMGFMRPAGLVDVHVSSTLLPATAQQLVAPKLRFNSLGSALGLREESLLGNLNNNTVVRCDHFDRSLACKSLRTLAGSIFSEGHFSQGGSAVTEEDILSIATLALLRAREEIRMDEPKGSASYEDSWFTGAALFTNMGGDSDLSLTIMCALGKKGVESPLSDVLAKTSSYYSKLIKGEGESYRSERSQHWIRA